MTVDKGTNNVSNEAPQLESIEIVVSGLSGRFPESSNVEEFAENLFGGVDMINDDGRRWTPGVLGLPPRSGKLKELDKFDADYFSVHAKQADFMDPQLRMLLEVTHEAIMDAGVNPQEIRGQNVGVFIGASASESEVQWINDTSTTHGYALTGCQRTMFSNRISFAFDFKGPSFCIDTACSSSLLALQQAHLALRFGLCDAAIVGGVHLCLNPKTSFQFHKLNMLSPHGKCRSFDASGDGYVRSEAVVAIFLQRKNVARRYYASILAVKTNTDGHKAQGVTFPSGDMQKHLLEATYKEAGIDPRDVVYVEAHGTGTPAGDPQELNAIAEAFCKDRNPEKPLLIGSVKSNMGHSEPASGLCGVAKVLLAMQRGMIPGNLHYTTPNSNIPALKSGRVKVVAENMKWNGGIVGINSFGFGGANVHLILESNQQCSFEEHEETSMKLPYLIPFSGLSKDSVEWALKEISSRKIDMGQMRLLHEIHSTNIPRHQFRGFAVIPKNQTETEICVTEIKPTTQSDSESGSPQVWFVFNGMGSQRAGIGTGLMKFQTCKESLEKSAAILKTANPDLDLLDVLMDHPESSFENILYSSISVAAVQIALVDLLCSLNIKPDGIIGYSLGELGAAYADGCMTAEQVILTVYAGCKAILDMGSADGAMAAVGLSWEQALKKCPEGIFPSCHNSKDSVTVSGPVKLINNFVDQLQKEGIFARKVNSSNQAFHSKYIEPARQKCKGFLHEIVPTPGLRSKRWISSSIPESQWDSGFAKTSSADYHMNNWVSPVLFKEAVEKIPSASSLVVIEIGPRALLQPILKRSLPNCFHIGLFSKNHGDNSVSLCNSIGEMFNVGLNPCLSALYPELQFQFPVPLSTPSLSSLVSKCWDHSKSWNFPRISASCTTSETVEASSVEKIGSGGLTYEICLENELDSFYSGHLIDGQNVFPQSGLILLAWKSWAKIYHSNLDFEKIPFVIENLVVSSSTLVPKKGQVPLKFNVSITKSTGEFRIEESGLLVASGTIRSPSVSSDDFILVDPIPIPAPVPVSAVQENSREIVLNQKDFYKYMRLRGYEYCGIFQGVKRASFDGGWAEVEFSNWAAFLDALLHPLVGFHGDSKSLLLPTHLKKLVVDPQKFWNSKDDSETNSNTLIPAFHYPNIRLLSCAGVQIQGQKLEAAPRNHQHMITPVMEKFEFTPNFDDTLTLGLKNTDDYCMQTCIGLVLENLAQDDLDLKILEVAQTSEKLMSPLAKKFCESQPMKTCDVVAAVSIFTGQESEDMAIKDSAIVLTHLDFDPSSQSKSCKIWDEISYNRNLLIFQDLKTWKRIAQDFHVEIGAFVLLRLSNSSLEMTRDLQMPEETNLTSLSCKMSNHFSFHLYKKVGGHQSTGSQHVSSPNVIIDHFKNHPSDLDPSYEYDYDYDYDYKWVENLKTEMRKAAEHKIAEKFRINIISRAFDSGQFTPSGILGLVNSVRRESGGQALRCFFVNDPDSPVLDFQHPDQQLQTVMKRDLLMNVYQNGKWGSYRFFPVPPQTTQPVKNAYLNFQKSGDLSSFQWIECPLKHSEENLCSVYYAALDFSHEIPTSGKLNPGSLPNNLGNQDCILGMEFSGLDPKGKRVMGILSAKAMATCVVPDPGFLWEVPSSWSLADAATVPVAYATAYYALIVRGGLENGESVLIHGGAGAVGLAAISIALSKNCRVFTTVGSTEKREFLKTIFPQLNGSCFANSRDTSFLQHVMNETNGKGVDLVLNSLAGDKLLASIECVAQHGRFLELGKVDLFNDTKLGMSILFKNVTASEILLDSFTSESTIKRKIWKLIKGGIKSGVVRPLKYAIFSDSIEEVEKAYFLMASGKHMEKILIQIRQEQEKPHEKIIKAQPRIYFDPLKSYIILGGLGGFGLELCGWMIERGATKLMLISRSGVTTGYQKLCLSRWKKLSEVSVVTSTKDATTFEGATKILKGAIDYFNGAPIGGIFNLAMVLRDGLLENQTPENFEAVAKPKINASMAMDKASRNLAPELEYFVCFSSLASGRGSPGQSNYAYANSALERICEMRKSEGFPALGIQWGPIDDVGVILDKIQDKVNADFALEGATLQKISSCLNTLDNFLQFSQQSTRHNNYAVLSSTVLASKPDGHESMSDDNWIESIAIILGVTVEELETNPGKSFTAFGMDSLMAAEVKQLIEVNCGRASTTNILQLSNLSLGTLLEIMPSTSFAKNQKDPKIPTNSEEQETVQVKDFKPLSPKHDSESEFTSEEPLNLEQEDLTDCSTFGEAHAKTFPSSSKIFKNPQKLIAYLFSMIILSVIYLILIPISSVMRFFAQISIHLFQDSSKIKLAVGSGESMFISENANSVNILKFSGVPKKEDLLWFLQTRLFKLQNNDKVDSKSNSDTTEGFWSNELCEKLKWVSEEGFWFCYWRKDENFDVARHVVYEQLETSDLDSEMPRLAKYYNILKWDQQEDSSSSARPWWEMRIVSSEKAQEFLLVFVWNHAYGDGRSAVRLFQQAFMDVPPPASNSKQIENYKSTFPSAETLISDKPLEFSMFQELNHILAKSKNSLYKAHLLTGSIADLILQTWDTRSDSFFIKSEPYAASSFGKFPLSLLKSVKDPDTGKSFNLNAVVLTIASRVYRRIAKESTISGVKCPTRLLPYVTWSPFENSHSNLVNDTVIIPIQVPLTFDSLGEGVKDTSSMLQTLNITQKNLAATGEMEKLLVVRQFLQQGSAFPLPLLRAISGPSLRCSFVYSNVLAVIPKTTQFLNGYKLKDIYGFAPPSPIILIGLTDSVNGSLSLTLTIGDTILNTVSPEFHQLFFPYFEQEMKLLEKSGQKSGTKCNKPDTTNLQIQSVDGRN